jgi:hypothetical protein
MRATCCHHLMHAYMALGGSSPARRQWSSAPRSQYTHATAIIGWSCQCYCALELLPYSVRLRREVNSPQLCCPNHYLLFPTVTHDSQDCTMGLQRTSGSVPRGLSTCRATPKRVAVDRNVTARAISQPQPSPSPDPRPSENQFKAIDVALDPHGVHGNVPQGNPNNHSGVSGFTRMFFLIAILLV